MRFLSRTNTFSLTQVIRSSYRTFRESNYLRLFAFSWRRVEETVSSTLNAKRRAFIEMCSFWTSNANSIPFNRLIFWTSYASWLSRIVNKSIGTLFTPFELSVPMLREFAFDAFSSSVMGLFNRTFTRMGCKVHFFSWRTERLRNLGNFLSISNTLAFLSVKSTIFSTSDAKFRAQVEVGIFRAFHAFSVFLNRRVLGAGNTFSAEFVVNSIIRAHHALLFSWIPESWLFTIDALISSIIGSCGRALTEV